MRQLMLFSLVLCSCGDSSDRPSPDVASKQVRGIAALSAMHPKFNQPDDSGRSPCDRLLDALDASPRPGLAVLFGTFGYDLTCPARYVERNAHRAHSVRFYLIDETWRDDGTPWSPGRLWRDLSTEELSAALSAADPRVYDALRARLDHALSLIEPLVNEYTAVTLVPFLEHSVSDAAAIAVANYIDDRTSYRVDLNPLDADATTWPYRKEVHGDALCNLDPSRCVANQDGRFYTSADSLGWSRARADYAELYFWQPSDQGLIVDNGRIIKPPGNPADRTPTFDHAAEYETLLRAD